MFWNFIGIAAALCAAAFFANRDKHGGAAAFLGSGAIAFVVLAAIA